MITKAQRLTKNKEIELVFKKGKASYDKYLGVKSLTNNLKRNRVAIIVSSKVSKKAIERNKIKRRIRTIFLLILNKIINQNDIVIITLPAIKEINFAAIKKSVIKNFKKLKLIKNV